MSALQIASAEEALRELLGVDIARLLRPRLLSRQVGVVDAIGHLPWESGPIDAVAAEAVTMLTDATVPGGLLDPVNDESDVPWSVILKRMTNDPVVGSRSARSWFAHGQRLLWADVPVSPLMCATSAYMIAYFEDLRGREHEVSRWMMTGAIESDIDGRTGLGVAILIRAARLLARSPT